MAKTTLSTIKNWFKTGLKPTQLQFWAVFDSFFHKDEKIPVSSVEELQNYLNAKAEKEAFNIHLTDAEAHSVLFDTKVDRAEGLTLISVIEQQRIAKLDEKHYAAPVNDLAELAAIVQADLATKQRRYVHAEGVDYFFDGTLGAGDIAPLDQVGGIGYWKRGPDIPDIIDDLLSVDPEVALSANQGRVLKGYYDALQVLLSSSDLTLDELQEIVDFIKLNRSALDNLGIASIAGLVAALAAKVDDTQVLTNVPANALFTDTLYNDIPIIARVAENEIDVAALEINKQDKLTTDSSLYLDPATQELRANVSSYDQKFTWLTGQSKTRALDFEPTKFLGVLRNGVDTEEYVFTSPTTFEFTGALANADVVKINYEHFIIQP